MADSINHWTEQQIYSKIRPDPLILLIKKYDAQKHVIEKPTNLKKGIHINISPHHAKQSNTIFRESSRLCVSDSSWWLDVDEKSPAVNSCDHLGHFQRVLLIGKQRSQIVWETCLCSFAQRLSEVIIEMREGTVEARWRRLLRSGRRTEVLLSVWPCPHRSIGSLHSSEENHVDIHLMNINKYNFPDTNLLLPFTNHWQRNLNKSSAHFSVVRISSRDIHFNFTPPLFRHLRSFHPKPFCNFNLCMSVIFLCKFHFVFCHSALNLCIQWFQTALYRFIRFNFHNIMKLPTPDLLAL